MAPLGIIDPSTVGRTLPHSPEAQYRLHSGDVLEPAPAPSFDQALSAAQGTETSAPPTETAPAPPAAGTPQPPAGTSQPPAGTSQPPVEASQPPAAQTTQLPGTHTTAAGDTLSDLAYAIKQLTGSTVPLHTLIQRLASDNGVANPDLIQTGVTLDLRGTIEAAGGTVGQNVILQESATPDAPAAPATPQAPATPNPQTGDEPKETKEISVAAHRVAAARPSRAVVLPPPTLQTVFGADRVENAQRQAQPAQTTPLDTMYAQQQNSPDPALQKFEQGFIDNTRRLQEQRAATAAEAAKQPVQQPMQQAAQPSNQPPQGATQPIPLSQDMRVYTGPETWPSPIGGTRPQSSAVGAQPSVAPQAPRQGSLPSAVGATPIYQQPTGNPTIGTPAFGAPTTGTQTTGSQPSLLGGTTARMDVPVSPMSGPVQPHAPQQKAQGMVGLYVYEQLLANPGGDAYVTKEGVTVREPGNDEASITARVGKDLKDAGDNLMRLAGDLGMGSTVAFQDANGQVVQKERRGLLGVASDFAKDLATGITFGAYNPDGEKIPEKATDRLLFGLKKIGADAIAGDLLVGVPGAAVNSVEDTALAMLNTFEVLPDATIGNLKMGKTATSAAFDHTQVVVNGVADVLPGGEAWARVFSTGQGNDWQIPVYNNAVSGETVSDDPRYAGVTNTTLRKSIETVGSVLSAVGAGVVSPAIPVAANVGASVDNHVDADAQRQTGSAAAPSSTRQIFTAPTGYRF